jgi:lysophospholipase L1-like esterase
VDITSLQVVFPGWYLNGSFNETAPGADITVTASIEYPASTFTQITFSASTSGTIPNGGYLVSDTVSVTIPADTMLWTRTFLESSSLLISVSGIGVGTGQQYEEAVSGLTDKSMGGSIASNSRVYAPVAIIGTTDQPSWAFIGDSITFGVGDASGDDDIGPYARALGGDYAYTKMARTGDTITKYVSGHTNRLAIANYASHWVYGYGSNDLFVSSRTDAQVLADLTTAVGYATDQLVYVSTITPRTQSSDGWQTVANQSQSNSTAEARRIDLNNDLRASSVFERVWELADTVENDRDGGWWLEAPSSQFYTTDGIHPTANGYALLAEAVILTTPGFDGGEGVLTAAAGPLNGETFSNGGTGVLTEVA